MRNFNIDFIYMWLQRLTRFQIGKMFTHLLDMRTRKAIPCVCYTAKIGKRLRWLISAVEQVTTSEDLRISLRFER